VRAAWLVTLPQAFRVALPAAGGQYQTLAKASSLAAAIGYPDLMSITTTTINQTGQAIEAFALTMAIYLALNLAIATLARRRFRQADAP
jgi:general L-amino acid transport system permease protein